jgi:hypothetical protein
MDPIRVRKRAEKGGATYVIRTVITTLLETATKKTNCDAEISTTLGTLISNSTFAVPWKVLTPN